MTLERVQGINPLFGMRIITGYDPFAKGFDDTGLVKALNAISDTRHDYDMLMESAHFDEVDEYYNPGTEDVSDDFVLEAIVVDKFSKTERRMAAVVRVLNKHLADSGINALEAIIGKPRKTGSYAYVTVQLPFSDGQVVSVIFHAPEGDKKQIGPSDQIIAFRWLLNKRDITQVVAPEDGAEISLESLAKRITQLVIKNSARFERTQKEAQAERQELDKAREDLKEAEERQRVLMDKVSIIAKDAESVEAKLSNTLALLEKQKSINAELQARLDAMRKTQPNGGTGGNTGTRGADPNTLTAAQELQAKLKDKTAIEIFKYAYENQDANPFIATSPNSDAYELGRWFKISGYAMPLEIKKSRGYTWKIFANNKKDVTATLKVDGDKIALESGNLGIAPPNGATTPGNTDAKYIIILEDILAGKYDADTDKIDSLLDQAALQAEKDGTLDQYEEIFNRAADHLTELYKKKQEAA